MPTVDDQLVNLQHKIAQLEDRVVELEQQVRGRPVPEGFAEYRGALFKRKSGDRYHECAYCPRCHLQIGQQSSTSASFACIPCGLFFDLGRSGMDDILADVASSQKP